MKSPSLICALVLTVAAIAWPQTSPDTAKAAKKAPKAQAKGAPAHSAAASRPAAKSAVPAKKVSSAASSKSGARTGRKPAVTAVSSRRGQVAPTPDRYREIQQALAERGFLKSEPNGVWDPQSAEALKQFQTENNLSPTGKLSSLSLIQLGLGPKHEGGAVVSPDPAPRPAEPIALPVEPAPLALPEN